ncbi:hypothetical protein JCM6882_000887 [Rhodosporidiobolus microsporus]
MVANPTVIFNEIPSGEPVAGKASLQPLSATELTHSADVQTARTRTIKKVEKEIDLDAPLDAGSVLVKLKVLSLDPYLRGRMRDEKIESYVPAFKLGEPIVNFGVGEVVKSENDKLKKGDHLYGSFPFQHYAVVSKTQADSLRVLKNEEGLPWTTWVGAAGMPGQTAWWGINKIGKPQKGETVFVSGATGPVGQVTIGLAHKAGAKVIASAGSDEKVKFLKEHLNVEVAFNYKKEDTAEVLKKYKEEQGGFHVYVDNVAGPTLEAALQYIEKRGRLVQIGAINDYNGKPYGIKNIFQIVAKELKAEGFIILNHDISEFYNEVPKYLADGTLPQPKEHITKGLDNGESFAELFSGANFGKAVISLE